MRNFLLEAVTNPFSDPTVWMILLVIIAMAVYLFFTARRRKQMQQQVEKMIDELRPGTRVRTVGGVIGRIKEIREESPGVKTVLLQTGSDKFPAYMLFDVQAIYGVFAEEGHTVAGNIIPKADDKKEEGSAEDSATEDLKDGKPAKDNFKDDVFNAREYVNKSAKSSSSSSSKPKKR